MKEAYMKSLQMIKKYNIKDEMEYNNLAKENLLLNTESLKFISGVKKFEDIIKLAKEV